MTRRPAVSIDRAAAVRNALVRLVAAEGFHGTSMAAVAKKAGVATGTAYVHYASKDELVRATYLEVKHGLGEAAVASIDPGATSRVVFGQIWHAVQAYLEEDPVRARFLEQVDSSPFAESAHELAMANDGDPLLRSPLIIAMLDTWVDLPMPVLFDLAVGPMIRLIASEGRLDPEIVPTLIEACWRAVTD
ncbi:MAG: transcriptional regulator, TetR family [Aeromicrobium sp.]|nr:transcriptional regulator, TetR family [Aeromicrobium sp.]